jgi:hypothetical protein
LPCLLIPSWCELFLHCLCWSHSLCLAFSSLGGVCFSIACAGLAHFASPAPVQAVRAFPCCPCWSCSLFMACSPLGSACFSHSPMSVLLTLPWLLVPRKWVLFCCPCWSCSLCLAFLSLESACLSSVAHAGLTYLLLPPSLQRVSDFPSPINLSLISYCLPLLSRL